ncbi:MAG: sulfite exporter TauE/SafE family protein [Halomonas sp.]|nr:sulfite exporter TauE/SafE family protein [Halomonas sp.]
MIENIVTWLDMPLSNWVGCAFTLALGAFVQRATGFGLAVIGLIAAIVLFAVFVTLCRVRLPVNRVSLFSAGVFSGIFGTVAAIGGPPMVLLMHGFAPDRLRGNLAAFFIITSLLTLATLAVAGQVGLWQLGVAATLLPAVLLGNALADAVAHRIDRQWLQAASLALCTLAAVGLLL